ncbi:hypothetical protein D3C83_107670 [compost metagenome]
MILAYYAIVIVVQILAALRLAHASTRLCAMTFASLPMMLADFAVSIAGAAAGVTRRRIGWSTNHR